MSEPKLSEAAPLGPDLRDRLIAAPEVILEDRDLMRALIAANERAMGSNIVDLRGIAMERLEQRLDRLEDTHRSVIAAAYENLAGTNQIQRAVLRLLDPVDFEDFLKVLASDVRQILRIEAIRLVLETESDGEDEAVQRFSDVLTVAPPGFVERYLGDGRTGAPRDVVLRQSAADRQTVYGASEPKIGSEAVMRLDLGAGRLPGMLALGAADPHQFRASQGTDLLTFFAGAFERAMRRWLA
ncbi:DUF484 family protein [Frigidibacter sp. RF13]|uniref:DUF484 family protein n=1 Tax=Frigidibacter sp. RF13 TaxID=2997340 RepID=UPI002271E4E0|nr:DUF484 family protein [Frigidibacter sp. RF13]MCY1126969.1 DUF484 family protein [Frigidibacter sp. RF13]